METLLVAVDGGGSSTRLWVVNEAGLVLGQGRGGPSSVMAVGADRAARGVAEAAVAAGLRVPDVYFVPDGVRDATVDGLQGRVAVVAITMAGVDREPENSQMRERVEMLFPNARVIIEHDAVGALLAGTLGGPGVLLLAGTGSISLSRGPGGELVRVAGWGPLVDDVGSGYWIGMEALRRSLRGEDGRAPRTALAQALMRATDVTTILDLVGPVHYGQYDRPAIARWASLVLESADAGDPVAEAILLDAAQELALLVATVIRRAPWLRAQPPSLVQSPGLGDGRTPCPRGGGSPSVESAERGADAGADVQVPVVTAGGLFAMGPTWRERVRWELATTSPQARLTVWVQAPIVGAVYVALQQYYQYEGMGRGAPSGAGEAKKSTEGVIPANIMGALTQLQAQHVEPF